MVLNFNKKIVDALNEICLPNYTTCSNYHCLIVFNKDEERTLENTDELIQKYGEVKWEVVDLVNKQYEEKLKELNFKFDLYHWINHDNSDDLAYFLNEAGSNTLNYSKYKIPAKFHLWLGKNGFVVGIEQKGTGFNALEVDEKRLRENEGAAFDFFRNCDSEIFFDNSKDAKIVYMEYLF